MYVPLVPYAMRAAVAHIVKVQLEGPYSRCPRPGPFGGCIKWQSTRRRFNLRGSVRVRMCVRLASLSMGTRVEVASVSLLVNCHWQCYNFKFKLCPRFVVECHRHTLHCHFSGFDGHQGHTRYLTHRRMISVPCQARQSVKIGGQMRLG